MKNKLEYRIENGSLIMDNYFNNLKIGSINCGGVESILFDEEYVALLKENKQLKDNWDKLREWLESNWKESQDIWFVKIINKMQKLEGSDSND